MKCLGPVKVTTGREPAEILPYRLYTDPLNPSLERRVREESEDLVALGTLRVIGHGRGRYSGWTTRGFLGQPRTGCSSSWMRPQLMSRRRPRMSPCASPCHYILTTPSKMTLLHSRSIFALVVVPVVVVVVGFGLRTPLSCEMVAAIESLDGF